MAQKLWEKNVQVNAEIDRFTVGRDREMDLYLAKHDVIGSMAHITMLESIGLLQADELAALLEELKNIYASAEAGDFVIEDGIEDVHSQVELMLTRKLGDIAKIQAKSNACCRGNTCLFSLYRNRANCVGNDCVMGNKSSAKSHYLRSTFDIRRS